MRIHFSVAAFKSLVFLSASGCSLPRCGFLLSLSFLEIVELLENVESRLSLNLGSFWSFFSLNTFFYLFFSPISLWDSHDVYVGTLVVSCWSLQFCSFFITFFSLCSFDWISSIVLTLSSLILFLLAQIYHKPP